MTKYYAQIIKNVSFCMANVKLQGIKWGLQDSGIPCVSYAPIGVYVCTSVCTEHNSENALALAIVETSRGWTWNTGFRGRKEDLIPTLWISTYMPYHAKTIETIFKRKNQQTKVNRKKGLEILWQVQVHQVLTFPTEFEKTNCTCGSVWLFSVT